MQYPARRITVLKVDHVCSETMKALVDFVLPQVEKYRELDNLGDDVMSLLIKSTDSVL